MTRIQLRKISLQAAVAFGLLMLVSPAMAQQDLGNVITNTTKSFQNIPDIFSLIAYISGLFLSVSAIMKIQQHVETAGKPGPSVPLSDGIKRFLAGGMFFATPMMSEATYNTFFGGGTKISITGRTGAGVSGDGLDAMVVRLMTDIGGPSEKLLTLFCYLVAIAFMLVGISRLTKRMEEGPRGPAGMGTIMTFMSSGALFAFGDMMGSFSASLFGDETLATRATIMQNIGLKADEMARISTVIEGVMAFIMLVGMIAFIRGWFVLRSFADGAQGATLAQGLTFLFGGALAINLGELVNAVQNTIGLDGITFS